MARLRTVSGILSIIVAPLCLVGGGLLILTGLHALAQGLFLLALVVLGIAFLFRGADK